MTVTNQTTVVSNTTTEKLEWTQPELIDLSSTLDDVLNSVGPFPDGADTVGPS